MTRKPKEHWPAWAGVILAVAAIIGGVEFNRAMDWLTEGQRWRWMLLVAIIAALIAWPMLFGAPTMDEPGDEERDR